MTSARTCAVFLLFSLGTVAACGGSSTKVDPAADLALAKRAVPAKSDLPGYSVTPHTAGDDLPASLKKSFAACLKVPTSIFDDAPGAQKATSDDFSKGESQISATAKVYPKKGDIDALYKAVSNAGAGPCLQKLFEDAAQSGVTKSDKVSFGAESVSRFDLGVGDHSVGYSVKLALTVNQRSAVFYADLVFLQRDRAGLDFEFVDINTSLDRPFETSVVQKVYDRIGTDAK
jgi:hypothetical protein